LNYGGCAPSYTRNQETLKLVTHRLKCLATRRLLARQTVIKSKPGMREMAEESGFGYGHNPRFMLPTNAMPQALTMRRETRYTR
jgi:hypothetical protein